jgi:hypothetical protein
MRKEKLGKKLPSEQKYAWNWQTKRHRSVEPDAKGVVLQTKSPSGGPEAR